MAQFIKNYLKKWKWRYFLINFAIAGIILVYAGISLLIPSTPPSYSEPKTGMDAIGTYITLGLAVAFEKMFRWMMFWMEVSFAVIGFLLSSITAPFVGEYFTKRYKKGAYWFFLVMGLCFNFIVWGILIICFAFGLAFISSFFT